MQKRNAHKNDFVRRHRRQGFRAIVLMMLGGFGLTGAAFSQEMVSSDGKLKVTGNIAEDMVAVHNQYRSLVHAPNIKWDEDLAAEAREYADHLAYTKTFAHDNAPESLYIQSGGGTMTYKDIANAWAGEKEKYRHEVFETSSKTISTTGNWADIGHYTQMVWRSNTRVGCAVAMRQDVTGVLAVCRYAPGGNVGSQWAYGDNAVAPNDLPVVESRALFHFNLLRQQHGLPALTWNSALASEAQKAVAGHLNKETGYATSANEVYDAIGWTDGAGKPETRTPSIRSILFNWTKSERPDKQAYILNKSYKSVGCATAAGVIGKQNRRMVICRFAG